MVILRGVLIGFLSGLLAMPALAQAAESKREPASLSELETLLIMRGEGDVVLTVDLDGKGNVIRADAISGPPDLQKTAAKAAQIFRYPNRPGATGLTQHVHLDGKTPITNKVAPIYPPIAKAAHAAGIVELVATIGPDGHVIAASPIGGPPMLQGSAKDALMQWVFPPMLRDGTAAEFHAIVDINFVRGW